MPLKARLLPTVPKEKTDSVDPNREKLLSDNDAPRHELSKTEIEAPNLE
jgi:hypothetical protein